MKFSRKKVEHNEWITTFKLSSTDPKPCIGLEQINRWAACSYILEDHSKHGLLVEEHQHGLLQAGGWPEPTWFPNMVIAA